MVNHTSTKISTGHQIEVPSSTPPSLQPSYSPTAYDYLALAPGLLVAATPLVLGWLDRQNKDKD